MKKHFIDCGRYGIRINEKCNTIVANLWRGIRCNQPQPAVLEITDEEVHRFESGGYSLIQQGAYKHDTTRVSLTGMER